MRSVGALADHYAHLHLHEPSLASFAAYFTSFPLNFSSFYNLICNASFYRKFRGKELEKTERQELKDFFGEHGSELNSLGLAERELIFPSMSLLPRGAVAKLYDMFGIRLFSLWKALLLNKKVLIVGDPPLNLLSLLTLAASHLTRNNVPPFSLILF